MVSILYNAVANPHDYSMRCSIENHFVFSKQRPATQLIREKLFVHKYQSPSIPKYSFIQLSELEKINDTITINITFYVQTFDQKSVSDICQRWM